MDDQALSDVMDELTAKASDQAKEVDSSFAVELENYTRHFGVRVLDDPDAAVVLKRLGEAALSEHPRLDGNAIRLTIQRVCVPKNAWDLCANAARSILESEGRDNAIEKLDSDVEEALRKYERE